MKKIIYVYGDTGVGKTSLLNTFCNTILKDSSKKVLIIDTISFISECLDRISNGRLEDEILSKYYAVDYLLIDNFQYFNDKPFVQKYLHKIFEIMIKNNKNIVIASNINLNSLKLCNDIKDDLLNCLQVEMKYPSIDIRKQIVKREFERQNTKLEISNDIVEYISKNANGDIRYLEGSVNRIMAFVNVLRINHIDINVVKEVLSGYIE